jgi:hypothetical protein
MTSDTEAGFQLPQAGPEHALLAPFVGVFTARVKVWMGPDQSMESTGVMTNTFQLGRLYLQQQYEGDSSDGPYPAYVGRGFWGFNTSAGRYEGFWIDNASTTMQLETGTVDATSKVWEMESEFTSPKTGGLVKKRSIITLTDNDHHRMDVFVLVPGQPEFKNMEIVYVRKH